MNYPYSNYPKQNFSEIEQIRDNEKRILKKISMGHFWIFMIMFATQLVAQALFIFSFGMSSLSFAILMATLLGDLACYQFFIRKINYPVKDMLRPRYHNLDRYLRPDILLMFFVIGYALNIIGSFISAVLSGTGNILFLSFSGRLLGVFSGGNYNIWFTITAVIVAPIMEEIIFRGAILKPLRRYGDGFAVLISATLFSLAHGNLLQIPPTFFLGLVFSYITVKSNSILPAIILHFLNNLMVVAEDFFTFTIGMNSLIFKAIDLFFIVGAIVFFISFFSKRGRETKLFDDIDAIPAYMHPKGKALVYLKLFIIIVVAITAILIIVIAIFSLVYALDVLYFIIEFWQNF